MTMNEKTNFNKIFTKLPHSIWIELAKEGINSSKWDIIILSGGIYDHNWKNFKHG